MLQDTIKPMTLYWKANRILKNCERDPCTYLKKRKARKKPSERKQKFFIIFSQENIRRLTASVHASRDYFTYVTKNMNRENETTEIEWPLTKCGDRFVKLRPDKEKWVYLKTSVWLVILFRCCLVLNGQYTKAENVNAAGSIIWDFASQKGLYAESGTCFVLIHH